MPRAKPRLLTVPSGVSSRRRTHRGGAAIRDDEGRGCCLTDPAGIPSGYTEEIVAWDAESRTYEMAAEILARVKAAQNTEPTANKPRGRGAAKGARP
jgi:hypothetical protein